MYIVSRVTLPRHYQGLYWELSLGSPSGAAALGPNVLWSTPPIQKSIITSILMVSPSMPKMLCVWQTCDGSSRVSSHCTPHKTAYRHMMMCRQMHWPTQILKAPGRILFHHTAKFQYLHGGWFLIFLGLCLSGTCVSLLAWSPSSVESGLVNLVRSGLTGLCCFDSE